jgi:Mrp family chromosome partitioning ATPase
MSSIADALKRAQQERERLKAAPAAAGHAAPDGAVRPAAEPSLAAVVLRKAAPAAPAAGGTPGAGLGNLPSPAVAPPRTEVPPTPVTPLTDAIRQAPPATAPAVRNEQRVAETIVEDYASKRKLHLPPAIVVYHDRAGPVAEQYRKMRDALMATHLGGGAGRKESQVVAVTSTAAGEGKTVTVINLGLSLAEVRANRVLLIDGCLHAGPNRAGGTLTNLMHLQPEIGLAELLTTPPWSGPGHAAAGAGPGDVLAPYVRATPWHNLFVLPAGARTTPAAAAELLQSPNLRTALRHLRATFDWVLIDAPAAAALPDAGLLGAAADGLLVAVALHRTPHAAVQKTVRRLKSMNLPVKSCILTHA